VLRSENAADLTFYNLDFAQLQSFAILDYLTIPSSRLETAWQDLAE
jgi:hypothetical protein